MKNALKFAETSIFPEAVGIGLLNLGITVCLYRIASKAKAADANFRLAKS